MTPSEIKEDDEIIEFGGITFVVHEKLMRRISPVKIDYKVKPSESGFVITSGSMSVSGQ